MEFLVKLIDVSETENQDARDSLKANCDHVATTFWLFEGDECALDEGIKFSVVGEAAIEAYGDLSGSEIREMVIETYGVDRCYL